MLERLDRGVSGPDSQTSGRGVRRDRAVLAGAGRGSSSFRLTFPPMDLLAVCLVRGI